MCGRFTMRTPPADVLDHFQVDADWQQPLRFNIAPTQEVSVVRADPDGSGRILSLQRWGLVPFWSKDRQGGARMINARGETVASKPAFRAAFRKRRCLVPADGYFEWLKSGGKKLPYYIRLRDDRLFALAGLWECWRGEQQEQRLETFTIVTVESNELTRPVHDRMPAILDPKHYDRWLDSACEDETLLQLLRPYDSSDMTMDRVSTHVNNARHDDPQCVQIEKELF